MTWMMIPIIATLIIIYIVVALLMHFNLRCPVGHKWKYWQLLGGIEESKYRICTRCKTEMKGSVYKGGMSWNKKIPEGEYEKYKDIAPVPVFIVVKAIKDNRGKSSFILKYRGKNIKIVQK